MRKHLVNGLATTAGALLIMQGFVFDNVSAVGNYHPVLRDVIVGTVLALLCMAVPLIRGPMGWRIAAGIIALPAPLILLDALGRW